MKKFIPEIEILRLQEENKKLLEKIKDLEYKIECFEYNEYTSDCDCNK